MTPVAAGDDAFASNADASPATANSTIDPPQAQADEPPYDASAVKVRANGTRVNPAAATAFADGLEPSSDAVNVFPDAVNLLPDAAKVLSDAGKAFPDVVKVLPDAVKVLSDAVKAFPGAVTVSPDAVTVFPDAVKVSPDAATSNSEGEPSAAAIRQGVAFDWRLSLANRRVLSATAAPCPSRAVAGAAHVLRVPAAANGYPFAAKQVPAAVMANAVPGDPNAVELEAGVNEVRRRAARSGGDASRTMSVLVATSAARRAAACDVARGHRLRIRVSALGVKLPASVGRSSHSPHSATRATVPAGANPGRPTRILWTLLPLRAGVVVVRRRGRRPVLREDQVRRC